MADTKNLPGFEPRLLDLIQELSNASGVSGAEGAVRELVLKAVRPLADEVLEDSLGNVIVRHQGRTEHPIRVLLAAHMDEIGLMITADDGDGLYQFERVGGIDPRQLPGKAVLIGNQRIPGVIGARAIHLTTDEELETAISLDTLRIDAGNHKDIAVGERAVFATTFSANAGTLFGKALDDRLGVVALIELLRLAPAHLDLYCAFTTQEEVGLRGAEIAAYNVRPEIAIAVDATPALDFPMNDQENVRYNTRLGQGPAIYTMDRATISDPRLVAHFTAVAERYGIPYQIRQAGGGGTDAGAMHLQHTGIPSLSISTPLRHAHTPVGMVRKTDWENMLRLLYAALDDLTRDVLARER